jgi:exodeoxyribonuclease-3
MSCTWKEEGRMQSSKLLSWNVNGLRAVLKKNFVEFVEEAQPDALCIQETKMSGDYSGILPGYVQYHLNANRKGYSGVATFVKQEPLGVAYGMGIEEHDDEGRIITLEYPDYYLVNVYTPNAQRGLTRLDYRQRWDRDFLAFLRGLEKSKPVIACGDFNVAHKEIDLKNPNSNRRNAGFTDEEREGFTRLVEAGFVDTFREFNTQPGHYTWWSYMFNARAKNVGWRIDYFCISAALRPRLADAFILPEVMGSDHCPVGITIE